MVWWITRAETSTDTRTWLTNTRKEGTTSCAKPKWVVVLVAKRGQLSRDRPPLKPRRRPRIRQNQTSHKHQMWIKRNLGRSSLHIRKIHREKVINPRSQNQVYNVNPHFNSLQGYWISEGKNIDDGKFSNLSVNRKRLWFLLISALQRNLIFYCGQRRSKPV